MLKISIAAAFLLFGILTVSAQNEKPEPRTEKIPLAVRELFKTYWAYYEKDDWENIYKMTQLQRGETLGSFVYLEKESKYSSRLGFKAFLELALEDRMTSIPNKSRWKIKGCIKVLQPDGKEEWIDTTAFISETEEGWKMWSSNLIFNYDPKTKISAPCKTERAALPFRTIIKAPAAKN